MVSDVFGPSLRSVFGLNLADNASGVVVHCGAVGKAVVGLAVGWFEGGEVLRVV